jgi:hypothetical protein
MLVTGSREVGGFAQSTTGSGRSTTFRTAVVARDFQCLVTGISPNGCDAIHIHPLSQADTFPLALDGVGINDIRNGLLVSRALHRSFDYYDWTIDKDGRLHLLHPSLREDYPGRHRVIIAVGGNVSRRPSDELLRRHSNIAFAKWEYNGSTGKFGGGRGRGGGGYRGSSRRDGGGGGGKRGGGRGGGGKRGGEEMGYSGSMKGKEPRKRAPVWCPDEKTVLVGVFGVLDDGPPSKMEIFKRAGFARF